jgi:hypothetical protein
MFSGRGAFTLATLQPVPTEALIIPPLSLGGKLLEQNNAIINLDMAAEAPAPGELCIVLPVTSLHDALCHYQ